MQFYDKISVNKKTINIPENRIELKHCIPNLHASISRIKPSDHKFLSEYSNNINHIYPNYSSLLFDLEFDSSLPGLPPFLALLSPNKVPRLFRTDEQASLLAIDIFPHVFHQISGRLTKDAEYCVEALKINWSIVPIIERQPKYEKVRKSKTYQLYKKEIDQTLLKMRSLGLKKPQRLKNIEIAEKTYNNLTNSLMLGDYKPAVIFMPQHNWISQFYVQQQIGNLHKLGYEIFYFEPTDPSLLYEKIAHIGRNKLIDFLLIGGDGYPTSINFSNKGKKLDTSCQKQMQDFALPLYLNQNSTIALVACNTNNISSTEPNLKQTFDQVFPTSKIYAPEYSIVDFKILPLSGNSQELAVGFVYGMYT